MWSGTIAKATPEEMFAEATRIEPHWGEDGPDVAERDARSLALFRAAAEAGHAGALERLADGRDEESALDWAIALARAGECSSLVSALQSQDHDVERSRAVLAAAEAGEPWAQLTVGLLYELGMRGADGKLVTSKPDAFGFLPAAKDSNAVGREWKERAAAAGWAAAHVSLAYADRRREPASALAHLRAALADGGVLTPKQRTHAISELPPLLEATGASATETFDARELVANAGHVESMAWLGNHHRDAGDFGHAREWYERAVAKADVDALRELGRMYEEGSGVAVDETRARELYEQAAELGADPFARDRLADKFGLTWYARKKKAPPKQAAARPKAKAATTRTVAPTKKAAAPTKKAAAPTKKVAALTKKTAARTNTRNAAASKKGPTRVKKKAAAPAKKTAAAPAAKKRPAVGKKSVPAKKARR